MDEVLVLHAVAVCGGTASWADICALAAPHQLATRGLVDVGLLESRDGRYHLAGIGAEIAAARMRAAIAEDEAQYLTLRVLHRGSP